MDTSDDSQQRETNADMSPAYVGGAVDAQSALALDALRESEEKLRITLRSIGDAVISSDLDGRVVSMNPVAESLTGWAENEAIGQPLNAIFKIINEQTRRTVESPADNVLKTGRIVGLANHTLLIAKDGRETPIADSGAPIRNARGETSGVVLVFRDQTQERDASRALEESAARLRRAQKIARVGDWEFNLKTGMVNTSESARDIYGLPGSDLSIADVQKIPLPEYRPLLDAAINGLIHEGKPYDVEFTIRRPSDQALVEIHSVAEYDPQTGIVFGVIHDITERKRGADALRASEEKFRALFESAPFGIAYHKMVYDDNGNAIDYRFLDANTSYLELTGVDPRGKCVTEAFPGIENDPFDWIGTFGRVARTGERIRFEQYLQANQRWYDCVGYQVTPDYFVAVFMEITKRKQAEAERQKLQTKLNHAQKMEAVGQLAGGVAHDFNNMLMGIMGYAEMCREEVGEDHPVREWLDEIMQGAGRSANLTRQLLAFARKQTIAPKVLDLNDTVTDMLKMLRRLIGEDIDLSWKPGAQLWSVKLDPGQVDQVLTNLCVNARDAISGVGKITIETRNESIDADYCAEHTEALIGDHVVLTISDDGCGMDRETLAQVFEPFFTTKGVGEGTGLGLATVYGIVKQNNGFVNVYSEPGNGATIRIYLPRSGEEPRAREAAGMTAACPGGCETLMLVEDDKSVLAVTARFLEKLGYTVLAAETPAAALRLAAAHEGVIALLITDVVMPGMSGRDLAAELCRQYPRLKCLFISGYTANVIAHRGILEEGVHFLPKPFTRDNIARKVRDILDGKPAANRP